ncbi:MAG: TetR/AcrR family transcriptional regulator [Pseudomonadota bacterium]
MPGTKREIMREKLLDAAEVQLIANGLGALKARGITSEAGVSLGALYTAFEDLDLLILGLNSRTIAELHQALAAAVSQIEGPSYQLEALALAYLDFAAANPRRWAALFDHQMPPDTPVPDWHLAEHGALLAQVEAVLESLEPDLSADMRALRARTLFSAVHGIVKLSLERRFVALEPEAVRAELRDFLRRYIAGP